MTDKDKARQNEPSTQSVEAVMLGMIRLAKNSRDKKNGELRAAYSTADLRGVNSDAAKIAIKLVEGGSEAIDEYFKEFTLVTAYVQHMGKILSPAQYEMFGEKGRGPMPEDERAQLEGRAAGFRLDGEEGSEESSNPYPGSVKGQAWLKAFRQARAERNQVLTMSKPEEGEGKSAEGQQTLIPAGSSEEGKA